MAHTLTHSHTHARVQHPYTASRHIGYQHLHTHTCRRRSFADILTNIRFATWGYAETTVTSTLVNTKKDRPSEIVGVVVLFSSSLCYGLVFFSNFPEPRTLPDIGQRCYCCGDDVIAFLFWLLLRSWGAFEKFLSVFFHPPVLRGAKAVVTFEKRLFFGFGSNVKGQGLTSPIEPLFLLCLFFWGSKIFSWLTT